MPKPTIAEALGASSAAALGKVHTILPGTVLAYDRTTQTATVQPLVRSRYQDGATKELVAYLPPPITGCPVAFPSADEIAITWELKANDPVTLLFCERSIDEWKQTGSESEPRDLRRFDLSDCICLPGGRALPQALPAEAVAEGALVLWAGDLRLGDSTATSPVALSVPVDAALTALATVLAAWVVVPGDGGAALKALLTTLIGAGWPDPTGAAKVKAV